MTQNDIIDAILTQFDNIEKRIVKDYVRTKTQEINTITRKKISKNEVI
jgi:hypothetical protein